MKRRSGREGVELVDGHGSSTDGKFQLFEDSVEERLESVVLSSNSEAVSSSSPVSPSGRNRIMHRVSKFDTLPGVAIKYGVEVSDIKRLNGLVTDRQMFAHKYLQIPHPGKHPPSTSSANGSCSHENGDASQSRPRHQRGEFLKDFQSLKPKTPLVKMSPAMSSLQGYYGLAPSNRGTMNVGEGTEMAVYRTNCDEGIAMELTPPRHPPSYDPSQGKHRKSRSLVNGFFHENGEPTHDIPVTEAGDNENEKSNEKSVRRRQKADSDQAFRTPETLMKEDTSGSSSSRPGKGLPLRPKSASRGSLLMSETDSTSSASNTIIANGFSNVRRSSSTSNLQDSPEHPPPPPIRSASKWSLIAPDLPILSAVAPILDGFPKTTCSWKNKAALD